MKKIIAVILLNLFFMSSASGEELENKYLQNISCYIKIEDFFQALSLGEQCIVKISGHYYKCLWGFFYIYSHDSTAKGMCSSILMSSILSTRIPNNFKSSGVSILRSVIS